MSSCTHNKNAESGDTLHVDRECVNIRQDNPPKYTFIREIIFTFEDYSIYLLTFAQFKKNRQQQSRENSQLYFFIRKEFIQRRLLSYVSMFLSTDNQPQFGFKYLEYDFDLWLQAIHEQMADSSTKNQILKKLIITYYKSNIGIDIEFEYFCSRPQTIVTSKPNATNPYFILYGVDLLSTKMIVDIFQPNKITIKWIDDSSCLIFPYYEGKLALSHLIRPQDEQLMQKGALSFSNWIQLEPYYVYGLQRKLFLRYATPQDSKLFCKPKINRYGCFEFYRQSMPLDFLAHFNAAQRYQQLLEIQQYEDEEQQQQEDQQYGQDNDQQYEDEQKIENVSITANIDDVQQQQQLEGVSGQESFVHNTSYSFIEQLQNVSIN